ncbi:MAG: hypothetical protein ABIO48_05390 [Pedococcus sp.]
MPAAAWPLLALVGAAVASVLGGALVAFVSFSGSTGDRDDWSELGAILLGLAAGVVVFALSYVAGLVLAARRAFPPGRRVVPVMLALGIPVGLTVFALAASGVAAMSEADLPPAAGFPVAVAVLAAGPLAFAWGNSPVGRRRLLIAVAAVAALVVGIAGVGIGVERARTSRIVAQLPLVLFEGRTADAPFAEWRRDNFKSVWVTENRRTFTDQGHSAYLKYLSRGAAIFVTMYTEVGPCTDTLDYLCRVEGTANGAEQRSYTRVGQYGSYPRSASFAVLAYSDGSAVSVNGLERGQQFLPSSDFLTSPEEVLRSLVRVDRETFESATGSALRVR